MKINYIILNALNIALRTSQNIRIGMLQKYHNTMTFYAICNIWHNKAAIATVLQHFVNCEQRTNKTLLQRHLKIGQKICRSNVMCHGALNSPCPIFLQQNDLAIARIFMPKSLLHKTAVLLQLLTKELKLSTRG